MVNQDTEFEMLLKKYFGTIEIDKFPPEEFADLVKSAEEGIPLSSMLNALNKEKLRLYKKGRLGVIIDGTAHKVDSIKKKKKELEKLGYDTYMVFVNTSLEAALDRNEKRDRTVPVKVAKRVSKMYKTTWVNYNPYLERLIFKWLIIQNIYNLKRKKNSTCW